MKSRTKAPLSEEQINSLVKQQFGPDASCDRPVELTGGWFNTAYLVTIPEHGIEVVLKVAPPSSAMVHTYEINAMVTEIASTELLREKTSIPVPKIYGTGFDHAIIDRDFFFMEKLAGIPWNLVKNKLSNEARQALQYQVAEFQMQVNSLHGEWFGSVVVQDDASIVEKTWYAAFSRFMNWILNDYARFHVQLPRGWGKVKELLGSTATIFDEVTEPRLVDWDLWEGNVFVTGHDTNAPRITGIIDHERALWGDPLMEIMFMNPKQYSIVIGRYKDLLDFDQRSVQVRRAFYNLYFLLIIYLETYSRKYPFLFSVSIRTFALFEFKKNLDKIKRLVK
ncbi:MAG TPA: aminoglycoside phosphotransferase family protein [Candidatus Lokiarchaeia archaeon]|nr:aminoglycoside phosphotransferase family protein [Candidatus Lokiarchaeia archaeon]